MEEMNVVTSELTVEEPTKRRLPWGKIVLWILGGIVVIAGVVYATVLKPYVVVGKGLASLAKYDSAQVTYQTEDQKVKVVVEAAGEGKPVLVSSNFDFGSGAEKTKLELSGIFSETEMFVQPKYSDPTSIEEILVMVYPLITRTNTYKMAQPLWRGEKWLHVTLPKTEDEPEVKFEWDSMDEASKRMMRDLVLAVKPGKVERNYGFEGESYTKVSFGFRKERLVKLIEGIKDTKADVKVSQINSMIDIVESSEDWDQDLISFLIDKKGDLRIVAMQFPQIDEKVLEKSISEGASEDQTGMAAGLVTGLKGMVWQEEGDLISLGTVRFGQFDQVKAPEIPTNIVEGSVLWEQAVKELGPILGQMLMTTGQQSGTSVPTYPVATPRVNPGMYAPGKLKK